MISTVMLNNIIYCLLILVLILLTYLGIEGIRVLRGVRRLMDRLDYLTDIKEWLFFFRKIGRCSKK